MVRYPRKRYEYEKARFLRKKGYAYNDIKKELGVSKSSVSLWCRDVVLTEEHRRALFIRSRKMIGQKLGALANKVKREKEIAIVRKKAKEEIKKINKEELQIAGTMLYWAEGTKTKNTAVSNSNPMVIKFMVDWFKNVFNIAPESIKAHLHIHYGNDEQKIKKYWANLTGIPLSNFGKSFVKPKGTGHRTNILPNGVIKIRVSGTGTEDLRHRILAWTEKIYELSMIK